MSWRIGILALVAAVAAVAVAVWIRPGPAVAPRRPVSVIVSGDTAGWIVPCGCTTNQSGGMPRRGTFVRDRGKEHAILAVDVGGAPGGTSPYHLLKFASILSGEAKLGVVAHNIGAAEAALSLDDLKRLAAENKVPLVSTNLRSADGKLIVEPIRFAEIEGQRWAIMGVLSPSLAPKSMTALDPRDAVLDAARAAKGNYDHLLVLAYVPEAELLQLAKSLPEADIVVGGPTGQSMAPKFIGPTWVASATNKGKFLIEVVVGPDQPRSAWQANVVELTNAFADDAGQQAVVASYLANLESRDFAAAETGLGPELPSVVPSGYRIAGSSSCEQCHKSEAEVWTQSAHHHGWGTLKAKGFDVDASCQQCHTTGFGMPGGFVSAKRSATTTSIGCESCHGPSQAHVDDPSRKTTFVARDQCTRCHDRENSPSFDFSGYWKKVAHGKAVSKGGSLP